VGLCLAVLLIGWVVRYSRNAARFSRFWNQAPADDYELKQHRQTLLYGGGGNDDASSIRSRTTLAPPSTSTKNSRSPLSSYGGHEEVNPRDRECEYCFESFIWSCFLAKEEGRNGTSPWRDKKRKDEELTTTPSLRVSRYTRHLDWLRRWRTRCRSRLPFRRKQSCVLLHVMCSSHPTFRSLSLTFGRSRFPTNLLLFTCSLSLACSFHSRILYVYTVSPSIRLL